MLDLVTKSNFRKVCKIIYLFLSVTITSLYGESSYVLCIDGGGSKTILQVINQDGQIIPLVKDGIRSDKIETGASNINVVRAEGVKAVFHSLFENVEIDEENIKLLNLIPNSRIVAGMSGVGLPTNKEIVISLLEEWGINRDHIYVMTDGELALTLIEDEGVVLICGTGSICFGKKNQTIFRVGGLGRVLGDEGSGYQIGLQALKAALADEYRWGISTSLTPALKQFFNVTELKSLIPQINLGEMPSSKIASIAPIVFDKASENDIAAGEIIHSAAKDLGYLLATMLRTAHLSDCEVHLWGGVFKSAYADTFIQKIMEQITDNQEKLKIINKSRDNVAVLFATKYLLWNKTW